MNTLVTFSPPHGNLHSLDFSRERILLINRNDNWTAEILKELADHEVDAFVSVDHPEWELNHSFVATLIPIIFDSEQDACNLGVLGRHISSGKLLVCCTDAFPHSDYVKTLCDFEGIPVLGSPADLTTVLIKRLGRTPKEESQLNSD